MTPAYNTSTLYLHIHPNGKVTAILVCVQNPGTVVPKLVGELDENLGIDRHGHLVDGFEFPVGQTGLECHGITGQNSMTECDKTIVGDVVVTASGGHH